jgi:hypothetical protein
MTAPALDFDRFHREVLPARLATAAGRCAARDVRGIAPLAFGLPDGRAYRFVPAGDVLTIEATAGADGTVVELEETAWRDFVRETATGAGLLYAGRLRCARGTPADLERWEPALRALFTGRPIYDPEHTPLRDRAGAPLDPRRAFTLDDSPDELRHFLHTTGFLHVTGVFAPDEIARLAAVVERFQAAARPGDGRSWWAKRADGTAVLCRLIYLGLAAPEIAALSDDPRLVRLAALAGEPLRAVRDRSDGHSVVIKNPGIVEGLSDLPWHRDCGLGGHPITCPALNIGVQLDAATAARGQLCFVPGSWRASCHRADLARAPVVAVDTAPGDCTVHFGDAMHAAPPPRGEGPGRRALYVTFFPPRAFDVIPAGRSYNDVILARVGG